MTINVGYEQSDSKAAFEWEPPIQNLLKSELALDLFEDFNRPSFWIPLFQIEMVQF